jgi:cytochrome c oxidase subunit IV
MMNAALHTKERPMHRNHLVPCLVMLGAAVLIALAWGVQLGSLAIVGVMLLCPLAMLLMMRAMAGHHGDGHHTEHAADERTP